MASPSRGRHATAWPEHHETRRLRASPSSRRARGFALLQRRRVRPSERPLARCERVFTSYCDCLPGISIFHCGCGCTRATSLGRQVPPCLMELPASGVSWRAHRMASRSVVREQLSPTAGASGFPKTHPGRAKGSCLARFASLKYQGWRGGVRPKQTSAVLGG